MKESGGRHVGTPELPVSALMDSEPPSLLELDLRVRMRQYSAMQAASGPGVRRTRARLGTPRLSATYCQFPVPIARAGLTCQ